MKLKDKYLKFFDQLKPEHKKLAIYYLRSNEKLPKIPENLAEALIYGFDWDYTKYGYDFWNKIHNDIVYGSYLKEIKTTESPCEKPTESAIRETEGKLRWSLVDFESLEDMVKALEFGAKKYSDDNWKKGTETKRLCESILRHTFAFLQGIDNDPETGISQAGHIMTNAMFLAYVMKHKKEFDNRK